MRPTEDINDSSTIMDEATVRFAFNIDNDNEAPQLIGAYADLDGRDGNNESLS